MKIKTANSGAGFLIVLLMLITCAKEKDEEVYEDEEQSYSEAMFGMSPEEVKAYAIADWNKFKKESALMMNITERNLTALKIKMTNASENNKIPLRNSYNLFYQDYTRLKDKYELRNADFKEEVQDLNESKIRRNALFKEQFKKDMGDLNVRIEEIIDKSPQ